MKRVGRIVPGFWIATLIGAFGVLPFFMDRAGWFDTGFIKSLLASMFELTDFTDNGVFKSNPYPGRLNGSLWTISYEFRCYLLVMALGLIGMVRRRWMVLAMFVAAICIGDGHFRKFVASHFHFEMPIDDLTYHFYLFFLAGAVFYLFRTSIPFRGLLGGIAIAVIAFAATSGRMIDIALPICLPYVVFWAAFQPYLRFDQFARHGDYSYGVYLYAFLIQQILVALFRSHLNPLTLFLTATPLSLIAGFASWHLIEKRFVAHRPKDRIPSDKSLTSAAAPELQEAGT
jgi:peptidoglycan/LPS O-acetylase OafA/YrhL